MTRLRLPLLKATYTWLLDEGLTPYFLVDAEFPTVMVPKEYVEEGEIVLDASADAIDDMIFDEEGISFLTGFGEEACKVFFPIGAVIALYAEENDQGLFTTDEDSVLLVQETDEPLEAKAKTKPQRKVEPPKKEIKRGQLKLVK